jgi:ABC-type Fe3+-hydroxamate transport system substrate-binding protein
MKKLLILSLALSLVLAGVTWVVAHPHINKSVTAKLTGAEATVTYNTVPANEERVKKAAVGDFLNPRSPKLKLSAEVKAGSVTIPAGDYTVGAIKNGDKDFTLALYPGTPPRGGAPDMSKMIKLDSQFDTAHGKAEHLTIDISPGTGKLEGKVVLILHFGTLFLEGALS